MSKSMNPKLTQALEHSRAADKHLKTGLFKWKPDFDAAADELNQAGQCFRSAHDMRSSRDCYVRAAELYQKNGSLFHAGKALESAMVVYKDKASAEEIFNLANESSSLYQQYGSGDCGANVLHKAARILEEKSPDLAVKLYIAAADASCGESSQHQSGEYMNKAARILVRIERYDDAVDCIRREIGFHTETGNVGAIGRLTVAIVLVQLARGDTVAAEKAYKEWGNSCELPETLNVERLLQAFDEEDAAEAKKALNAPFIRSMDVEFARLATKIKLPEGMNTIPKVGIVPNAAECYYGQGVEIEDNAYGGQVYPTPGASFSDFASAGPSKKDDDDEELC